MNEIILIFLKCVTLLFTISAAVLMCYAMRSIVKRYSDWRKVRSVALSDALEDVRIRLPDRFLRAIVPLSFIAFPIISIIRKRRTSRAVEMLSEALVIMRGALKAGMSIQQALNVASDEIDGPLGEELAAVINRIELGSTVEDSLEKLGQKLKSEEVELFVRSVEILRRSGGNMIECLDSLIRTIDSRKRIEGRVRTLTAQGIMQAVTLLALPWFMVAALHYLAPKYISPLFDTKLGYMAIAVVVILEILGALWLRAIVTIRV